MWRLSIGLVLGFVVGLLMATITGPARAHMALPTAAQPLGWSYLPSCCATKDCAQAVGFRVRETSRGYAFSIEPGQHPMLDTEAYSDLIPYGDKRVKDSPDGLFHVCLSGQAKRKPSRTICLYVPPRGF